ncbi:hypothetical protein SAMN05421677_13223 [Halobacillus aidingensis]|uniref:Uncharacterized protein n=1 Tax=Halobacillus aidingensis TaxID=240303 RepID=A0A1H0V9P2_HALAD|nr:hypothetical protein SAMN05421677_13223 [Halobacillus aidingensis]
MNLTLIILVCVAFLTAIFSAGYDTKPGTPKK